MPVWLVKNGCGIACVILAWVLMAFSQYALLTIILLPQDNVTKKVANLVVFEFFSILALIAHVRTIFTDPGSVPQKTAPPELMQAISDNSTQERALNGRVLNGCSECCSIKPDRAHHCSICKRCIVKMDHHCPWVNNCVGERNQKFFVLFTFYITIIAFHALVLCINHFLNCLEADWTKHATCPIISSQGRPAPEKLMMLVFLTFEALLFSLFSAIMLCIQIKSMWTDWTGIENLKNESRDRQSGCTALKSVLGDNIILWFSPFTRSTERKFYSQGYPSTSQEHDHPA